MHSVQLFTAALCPFSHRTRLLLAEKGIDAQLIEVDLRNKPAEFLAMAPRGEVPVLRHAHQVVWEAGVISEYLEEAFPEAALMPTDAAMRARARMWIQFADTQLYAHTRALLYAQDPAVQRPALLKVMQDLHIMEQEGLARRETGPYWLGSDYSIVDATIYPWFEQLDGNAKTQPIWKMHDDAGELEIAWLTTPTDAMGRMWLTTSKMRYCPFDGSAPIEVHDEARQRGFRHAEVVGLATEAGMCVVATFGAFDETVDLSNPNAKRMLVVMEVGVCP